MWQKFVLGPRNNVRCIVYVLTLDDLFVRRQTKGGILFQFPTIFKMRHIPFRSHATSYCTWHPLSCIEHALGTSLLVVVSTTDSSWFEEEGRESDGGQGMLGNSGGKCRMDGRETDVTSVPEPPRRRLLTATWFWFVFVECTIRFPSQLSFFCLKPCPLVRRAPRTCSPAWPALPWMGFRVVRYDMS